MLPHHIPAPSTDLLIVLTISLMLVYGFIGGAAKLSRVAISLYVGLVLAANFGPTFHATAAHAVGHGPFGLTMTMTNLLLLVIPVVILQFGGHHHGHVQHRSNGIVIAVLALLTAMLAIASVITQFTGARLDDILMNSNLATQIYTLKLVWLAAVPFAIAALAIFKPMHH